MTRVNEESGEGKRASEVELVKGLFVCVFLCSCASASLFHNYSPLLEYNHCTVMFSGYFVCLKAYLLRVCYKNHSS